MTALNKDSFSNHRTRIFEYLRESGYDKTRKLVGALSGGASEDELNYLMHGLGVGDYKPSSPLNKTERENIRKAFVNNHTQEALADKLVQKAVERHGAEVVKQSGYAARLNSYLAKHKQYEEVLSDPAYHTHTNISPSRSQNVKHEAYDAAARTLKTVSTAVHSAARMMNTSRYEKESLKANLYNIPKDFTLSTTHVTGLINSGQDYLKQVAGLVNSRSSAEAVNPAGRRLQGERYKQSAERARDSITTMAVVKQLESEALFSAMQKGMGSVVHKNRSMNRSIGMVMDPAAIMRALPSARASKPYTKRALSRSPSSIVRSSGDISNFLNMSSSAGRELQRKENVRKALLKSTQVGSTIGTHSYLDAIKNLPKPINVSTQSKIVEPRAVKQSFLERVKNFVKTHGVDIATGAIGTGALVGLGSFVGSIPMFARGGVPGMKGQMSTFYNRDVRHMARGYLQDINDHPYAGLMDQGNAINMGGLAGWLQNRNWNLDHNYGHFAEGGDLLKNIHLTKSIDSTEKLLGSNALNSVVASHVNDPLYEKYQFYASRLGESTLNWKMGQLGASPEQIADYARNYSKIVARSYTHNPAGFRYFKDGGWASLTPNVEARRNFARSVAGKSVEHLMYATDKNPLGLFNVGTSNKVEYTPDMIAQQTGAYTIHNHPSGRAFSPADVLQSIALNAAQASIVTKRGLTATLTRPEGGWRPHSRSILGLMESKMTNNNIRLGAYGPEGGSEEAFHQVIDGYNEILNKNKFGADLISVGTTSAFCNGGNRFANGGSLIKVSEGELGLTKDQVDKFGGVGKLEAIRKLANGGKSIAPLLSGVGTSGAMEFNGPGTPTSDSILFDTTRGNTNPSDDIAYIMSYKMRQAMKSANKIRGFAQGGPYTSIDEQLYNLGLMKTPGNAAGVINRNILDAIQYKLGFTKGMNRSNSPIMREVPTMPSIPYSTTGTVTLPRKVDIGKYNQGSLPVQDAFNRERRFTYVNDLMNSHPVFKDAKNTYTGIIGSNKLQNTFFDKIVSIRDNKLKEIFEDPLKLINQDFDNFNSRYGKNIPQQVLGVYKSLQNALIGGIQTSSSGIKGAQTKTRQNLVNAYNQQQAIKNQQQQQQQQALALTRYNASSRASAFRNQLNYNRGMKAVYGDDQRFYLNGSAINGYTKYNFTNQQGLEEKLNIARNSGLKRITRGRVGNAVDIMKNNLFNLIPNESIVSEGSAELRTNFAQLHPRATEEQLNQFSTQKQIELVKKNINLRHGDLRKQMEQFLADEFNDVSAAKYLKLDFTDTINKNTKSGFVEAKTNVSIGFDALRKELQDKYKLTDEEVSAFIDKFHNKFDSITGKKSNYTVGSKMENPQERLGMRVSKGLKDVSWRAASISMSSMGVYFSLMGVFTQLKGTLDGLMASLSDLNGVFQNVGYVNAFSTGLLNSKSIMDRYSVTTDTLVKGWQRAQLVQSEFALNMSSLAAALFQDDKFVQSLEGSISTLFGRLTEGKSLDTFKELILAMADAIPAVVDGIKTFMGVIQRLNDAGLLKPLVNMSAQLMVITMLIQPLTSGISLLLATLATGAEITSVFGGISAGLVAMGSSLAIVTAEVLVLLGAVELLTRAFEYFTNSKVTGTAGMLLHPVSSIIGGASALTGMGQSQQSYQGFDSGGIVQYTGRDMVPGSPDDTIITAKSGETVLTPKQMQHFNNGVNLPSFYNQSYGTVARSDASFNNLRIVDPLTKNTNYAQKSAKVLTDAAGTDYIRVMVMNPSGSGVGGENNNNGGGLPFDLGYPAPYQMIYPKAIETEGSKTKSKSKSPEDKTKEDDRLRDDLRNKERVKEKEKSNDREKEKEKEKSKEDDRNKDKVKSPFDKVKSVWDRIKESFNKIRYGDVFKVPSQLDKFTDIGKNLKNDYIDRITKEAQSIKEGVSLRTRVTTGISNVGSGIRSGATTIGSGIKNTGSLIGRGAKSAYTGSFNKLGWGLHDVPGMLTNAYDWAGILSETAHYGPSQLPYSLANTAVTIGGIAGVLGGSNAVGNKLLTRYAGKTGARALVGRSTGALLERGSTFLTGAMRTIGEGVGAANVGQGAALGVLNQQWAERNNGYYDPDIYRKMLESSGKHPNVPEGVRNTANTWMSLITAGNFSAENSQLYNDSIRNYMKNTYGEDKWESEYQNYMKNQSSLFSNVPLVGGALQGVSTSGAGLFFNISNILSSLAGVQSPYMSKSNVMNEAISNGFDTAKSLNQLSFIGGTPASGTNSNMQSMVGEFANTYDAVKNSMGSTDRVGKNWWTQGTTGKTSYFEDPNGNKYGFGLQSVPSSVNQVQNNQQVQQQQQQNINIKIDVQGADQNTIVAKIEAELGTYLQQFINKQNH